MLSTTKRLITTAWQALWLSFSCCFALMAQPLDKPASALLAKHAELAQKLVQNNYRRPLFLESQENKSDTSGDVYAVLDFAFQDVDSAFRQTSNWCEMMILHINTKYCRAQHAGSSPSLKVHIGRKTPQALKDTSALEFGMAFSAPSPAYFLAQLHAGQGPLGTSNYRIELQAVPLPHGKTFMHLRYSYAYGLSARLAMQGYLATLGSGKNGFTRTGSGSAAGHVGGMRGAVERNTMRYYLAIEAFLALQGRPGSKDAQLEYWFDATEQYAFQLHELDKPAYMAMKQLEYARQTSAPAL